jgi:hypothetical protein
MLGVHNQVEPPSDRRGYATATCGSLASVGRKVDMKTQAIIAVATVIVVAQCAHAIDYKKNTISGGGTTAHATFSSYSSITTLNGSNTTTVTSGVPAPNFQLGDFDWAEHGFGNKTLDQKIRDAEQKLFKLYFIRDVCRKLQDEIRITFEKKDIREVLTQVSEVVGTELPYDVPEGSYIVEKSDVSGMPTDQFLASVAQVCGLTLKYERDKLVFIKQEHSKSSNKTGGR